MCVKVGDHSKIILDQYKGHENPSTFFLFENLSFFLCFPIRDMQTTCLKAVYPINNNNNNKREIPSEP